MNFHMRCLCGPRQFVADAVRAPKVSDPTGTMPLQRRFNTEMDKRWSKLRKMVPTIVGTRTDAVNTIAHAAATGQDPVRAFQAWFDKALKMVVTERGWMGRFVRESGDLAIARASTGAGVEDSSAPVDRIPPLQTLAHTELQGIAEAVSQQAVRAFANGLMLKKSPGAIGRDVQQIIDVTGKHRSRLLVSFITVRAYSAATLDALRARGVKQVGIIPEKTGKPLVTDAKPKRQKRKVKKKARTSFAGMVEVQTAEDELVCPTCEDIADEGPYYIDEAESLIPAHPNCRCAFVPASEADMLDAFVDDKEWDESEHPRDKEGKFTFKGSQDTINSLEASNISKVLKSQKFDFAHVDPASAGGDPTAHQFAFNPTQAGKAKDFFESADYSFHQSGVHGNLFKLKVAPETTAKPPSDGSQWHYDVQTDLVKVGEKKGSNPGGVYKDPDTGDQFYIKSMDKAHQQNELLAKDLYKLAGAKTLDYVPTLNNGDTHYVATKFENLDKNNVLQLSPDERKQAQADFAVHAWLANWDAAGTGGDNQGVKDGVVKTLDVGGALEYRAQGAPKGDQFGSKVNEWETMRLPMYGEDAAKLYGDMTDEQLHASIQKVADIPDTAIINAVWGKLGKTEAANDLAEKLIARKQDLIAKQDTLVPSDFDFELELAPALNPTATSTNVPEKTLADFKTKTEYAKHLLEKGTTSKELLQKVGWPSISMPAFAKQQGLELEVTKQGNLKFYKGTPVGEKAAATASKATAEAPTPPPVAKNAPAATPAPAKAPVKPPNPVVQAPGEGTALGEALKAAGVDDLTHYPAHSTKQFESYATGSAVNAAKMYAALESGGYQFEKYTVPKSEGATYGAKVPVAYDTTDIANKGAVPKPGEQQFDINTPAGNFAASLKEQGVDAKITHSEKSGNTYIELVGIKGGDIGKASQVAQYHPNVEKVDAGTYMVAGKPVTPKAPTPSPFTAEVHTPDELKKAEKATKLTSQYVPNAVAGDPQTESLIKSFNDKWEGKTNLTPAQLSQKVGEFKAISAAAKIFAEAAQKNEAIKAANKKAAEAAAKASLIKNLYDKPEEEQREYWLSQATGEASHFLQKAEYPASQKQFKDAGVTRAEIAFIKAFTGPYSSVNQAMRDGHMNQSVFHFKHIMNEALAKMPKHNGDTLYRKIELDAQTQAKYVVGEVAHWKAFNSTSKNEDTWSGNTHFIIKNPKSGVDVQSISSHPHEAEVIMPADTYYVVLSKTKSGSVTTIEMEEVLPFGHKKLKKAA